MSINLQVHYTSSAIEDYVPLIANAAFIRDWKPIAQANNLHWILMLESPGISVTQQQNHALEIRSEYEVFWELLKNSALNPNMKAFYENKISLILVHLNSFIENPERFEELFMG